MKILIFASQFSTGAAERLQSQLSIDLNARGVWADIVGLYKPTDFGCSAEGARLTSLGIPGVYFLGLSVNPSLWEIGIGIVSLIRLLRHGRYDVVETSSYGPSLIAAVACVIAGVTHVCGIHRSYDRNHDRNVRTRLLVAIAKTFRRTHFYCVSQSSRHAWRDFSNIDLQAIALIYNCLLPEPNQLISRERLRQELALPDDTKIVLCVGRIASYKCQDVVLQALLPIAKSSNLSIVFAGEQDNSVPGTEQMLARINKIISSHPDSGCVRFLGFRQDVRRLMRESDVLVHIPSQEAFGLVLVEALAAGIPIVASSVDGIPEILSNSSAQLVRVNDPTATCDAVLKVLAHSLSAATLERQQNSRVASHFSPVHRAEEMVGFVRSLIPPK
jgi:glycosyltransferase involved in cell wall biosynthesis